MDVSKQIDRLLERARRDERILAVMLFGSRARQEQIETSDADICLILVPDKYEAIELSQKKLEYLTGFDLDIHVYQQLPLYIRVRVLKEGKVLYCRDEDQLYEVAFKTIEQFGDFEHIYRDYLREVARG